MAEGREISKNRVETLTDGIYAIAMTLLVLSIGVPTVPPGISAEVALPGLVTGLWHEMLACAIAFLVLLSFWLSHERVFQQVVRVDRTFGNLNLGTLLGIVFVPFSAAITSDYPGVRIAIWCFALNLGAIGFLYAVQWAYLLRHPALLRTPIARPDAWRGLVRSLCTPAAALLAVAISFPTPDLSSYAYMLIPVFLVVADHMWSR